LGDIVFAVTPIQYRSVSTVGQSTW